MTTPSPSPPPPPPPPPSAPYLPPPTAPAAPTWAKCFNSVCSEKKSKKAWRLRSGEQAELCEPCFAAYEEGRFCETFHLNDSGWRCCESCRKRVHCGCIVSVSAFTLLDAGGIECVTCARKHAVVTSSNPTWQTAFYYHGYIADRGKDASVKKLNYLAKSGPVPWRQAPSLFNSSITQTVAHPMFHSEADRLNATEKLSSASLEKGKPDNSVNGNTKHSSGDKIENGHPGPSNVERQSSSIREDSSTSQIGFSRTYTSINETKGKEPGCSTIPMPATSLAIVVHNGGGDAPVEPRPRGRPRGKSQLLPRYWPRFTNEELQRISGKTNAVITPLFEKMLSASDAGRVGRLVLPKKCAETYLPPISQAEGLPLKVHDYTGKEWVFQFRFWPNNNSRMYVLEGVTPCIQSMFLQAGDIVTFSRLDPGGKLVMGFRKAINVNPPSSEYPAISNAQDTESTNPPTGTSGNGEGEVSDRPPWYKVDKSDYIATPSEVIAAKPSSKKRKNSSSVSGSKGKSLKMGSDDLIQLQVTWEESQGLLRPPAEHPSPSSVVSIDGYDFEEFEEAPVIGKPAILATDKAGNKFQWTQCEDCSKWRKIPLDALLPFQWTCSRNLWDLEKASCVADQESSRELLKDLLPPQPLAAPKKLKAAAIPEKDGGEAAVAAGGGTDVILEEGGAMTTKHPRHKPGCSCIVCIQPPSGKGPKHKPDCTCTVCEAVKRRFTTQQIKRNERKEAESKQLKQLPPPPAQQLPETTGGHDDDDDDDADPLNSGETGNNSSGSNEASKRMKSASSSPFKGRIDLNIKPEREEEALPALDSVFTKTLHNVEEMSASRPQKVSSSPTSGSDGPRQPEETTTSPPNDASQLASKLILDAALQMKVVSQTYGNDGNNTQQLATGDQILVAAGEGKSTESDDSSLAKLTEEALPASASPQQLLDSNLPNSNKPATPPNPQSTTSLDCPTRLTTTQ